MKKVKTWFLPKLENELPAQFTYHNAVHTRGVIGATDYLAKREGVPNRNQA